MVGNTDQGAGASLPCVRSAGGTRLAGCAALLLLADGHLLEGAAAAAAAALAGAGALCLTIACRGAAAAAADGSVGIEPFAGMVGMPCWDS